MAIKSPNQQSPPQTFTPPPPPPPQKKKKKKSLPNYKTDLKIHFGTEIICTQIKGSKRSLFCLGYETLWVKEERLDTSIFYFSNSGFQESLLPRVVKTCDSLVNDLSNLLPHNDYF